MPLTLTLTQGVLPASSVHEAARRIAHAFLKWHALSGNSVMTPNVTSQINILPAGSTLSGGEPVDGAWLEAKVPSFALSTRETQEGFFLEATEILHKLSGGTLPKERIWTNAVHTVDGTWNMNGRAMTNAQLGAAIATG